jgi:hypothetical protein
MKPPIVAPDSPFPDFDFPEQEVLSNVQVGDGEITVSYNGTFDIIWRGYMDYLIGYKPCVGCFLSSPIFWSMLWLVTSISQHAPFWITIGGAFAIFLAVMFLQIVIQVVIICIDFARQLPVWNKNRLCSFSLTPEGYYEKMPGTKRSKIKWKRVKCIKENAGNITFTKGIFTGGNYVPREAFKNSEDAKVFYETAYKLWKSNGRAWHEVIGKYQKDAVR